MEGEMGSGKEKLTGEDATIPKFVTESQITIQT